MVTADTIGSTVTGGTNHVPIANLPVSSLNQTVKLDGGYLVLPQTKLSVNYTYADKQRNLSVTDHNHESTLGGKVLSTLTEGLDGSIGYSHAVRTASNYNANAAWLANTYTATNMPGAGMFYLAARTRDEISADLSYSPNGSISTSLTAKFDSDHYPDSYFGITNDHSASIGPDIAYRPYKNVSTHLYYMYEEVFTDENFSSSNSATAARTDWTLGNKDTIHTIGAKADWQVDDKLKVSLEDNLSYGATSFAEGAALITSSTGVGQTQVPTNLVTALPDDKTITNAFAVSCEYKLESNVSLLGQYGYERAIAKDYLYSQAAGSASNGPNISSLPGDGNPSYAIHVVSMAVRVKW
jgi:MtrB/PioB family decaheme-associated outer membrane protein